MDDAEVEGVLCGTLAEDEPTTPPEHDASARIAAGIAISFSIFFIVSPYPYINILTIKIVSY